jgi:hypothetical protein
MLMKSRQWHVSSAGDVAPLLSALACEGPDLVLVFGAIEHFAPGGWLNDPAIAAAHPPWVGCSSAGEILGPSVQDHSVVVTALKFAHADSRVCAVSTRLSSMADSLNAGQRLAQALPHDGLRAVLLFGTGVAINGSALVLGLQQGVADEVQISGGLAADGGAFRQTWTLSRTGVFDDQVVAIGLYGSRLFLANSSCGGWEPFGPLRRVTSCHGNVLYALDHERALDIYQRYLGDYARDLPGSGLLFPCEMIGADRSRGGVIRTLLACDGADGSLTFAGDIEPDGYLRLMHASTERLIEGAEQAARMLAPTPAAADPPLALLVSCVGRRLVMGDRVEEELEAVLDILGAGVMCAGFYSNGEISEAGAGARSRLYNQTMTITLIGEH